MRMDLRRQEMIFVQVNSIYTCNRGLENFELSGSECKIIQGPRRRTMKWPYEKSCQTITSDSGLAGKFTA
jgi:hypothetical protein